MVEFGALTDKGMQRSENQDTLLIPPADIGPQAIADKGFLFVVADGMGGHAGGKEASGIAAQAVMRCYYDDEQLPGPALVRAVQTANAEVLDRAQEPAFSGMGTTIVAAVVLGRTLLVAHVGDSRAYLFRDNEARLLTEDHSWVGEQVRGGVLTAEQAQSHSQRHVLMRALGREPEVKVDIGQLELVPGDQLLLCSDGLWELVELQDLHSALDNPSPQAAAEELVSLANHNGGPDNVTVVVIRPLAVDPSEPLPGDTPVREESPSHPGDWLAILSRGWRLALVALAVGVLLLILAALALLLFSDSSDPGADGGDTTAIAVPTQTLIPVDVNGTAPGGSDEQLPGPSLTATLRPVINGTIVASPGANVRQGPSVNNSVLDTLPLNTTVRVLCWKEGASSSVWYRVRYSSGAEGFVWSDLVELQGASHSDVQQCE